VNFLRGFLFRLVFALAEEDGAESLERCLHSVIAGVAADHQRTQGA
jgi:hypothetical protein